MIETEKSSEVMSPLDQSFGKQISMLEHIIQSSWKEIFRRNFIRLDVETISCGRQFQVTFLS